MHDGLLVLDRPTVEKAIGREPEELLVLKKRLLHLLLLHERGQRRIRVAEWLLPSVYGALLGATLRSHWFGEPEFAGLLLSARVEVETCGWLFGSGSDGPLLFVNYK